MQNTAGEFTQASKFNINAKKENLSFFDINGDGFTDIYQIGDAQDTSWLNDGTGNFPTQSYALAIDCPQDKLLFADLNSDGMIDIIEADSSNKIWFNTAKHTKLTTITDSFNNIVNIEYKPLTDDTIYTKQTNATYPNLDITPAQEVVSSVTATGLNDVKVKTTYKYEGLKVNLKGLGSLGFAKVTTTNHLNNSKSITDYRQDYPYIGMPKDSYSFLRSELLSKSIYDYTNRRYGNNIYQIRNTKQTTQSYENGTLLKTTLTENSNFDDYGNTGTSVSTITDATTGDVFKKTANNVYTNDTSNWILSRLVSADVKSEAYEDTKTKQSSFTYDKRTGILKTETIEPCSSKWLKKSYTYDSHGNKIKESISGADISTRETITSYDSLGKFATKITNTLGHSETRKYNADGQVVKITSPNGLVTSFTYDNFGKKTQETRADGTKTTYNYNFDTSIPQSFYSITAKRDGAPASTTYFSKLNQELRTQTIGFDGKKILTDTYYDQFGNVVKKSSPYSTDETPTYEYIKYDKYQRVKEVNMPAPNGARAISSNEYDLFTVITTNAKGQTKKTTKNALGKVVKVEEEEGTSELYTYDALSNLVKTTDSQGNEILLEYDIFGNKIYQNDPDMGEWYYKYDALGELVSQTDAKGQTTTISYDKLGRKISENTNGVLSTWQYDTTKKGKLHKESKPNFSRTYSYDNLLRLKSTTTTTDGQSFTKSFTYDKFSRVDTKTLPKNFQIKNVYNEYGYLEAIKSPKKQIKDFDPEHFAGLIEKTLDDAIDSYKKSLEYKEKARQLAAKAAYYTQIASRYSKYKEMYLNYAKRLKSYAARYEYYGQKYKRYATYYKNRANLYMSLANRFSHWWGRGASRYFKRLADKYNWYSSRYAYYSNLYLNAAKRYENYANSYENSANNGIAREENYYLNLAKNAVKESKEAAAIAKNYSQRSEDGYEVNKAYQEILDDSNYNYFYKVLKQDSYGRVTKYISGNGLITSKEYDNSGALDTVKTGYNFDDAIRELNFEYDLVANVTSREDEKLQVTQKYEYDNLNRIVSATTSTQNNYTQLSYAYDSIGNMTYKSDIGSYAYLHKTVKSDTCAV